MVAAGLQRSMRRQPEEEPPRRRGDAEAFFILTILCLAPRWAGPRPFASHTRLLRIRCSRNRLDLVDLKCASAHFSVAEQNPRRSLTPYDGTNKTKVLHYRRSPVEPTALVSSWDAARPHTRTRTHTLLETALSPLFPPAPSVLFFSLFSRSLYQSWNRLTRSTSILPLHIKSSEVKDRQRVRT